MFTNWRFDPLWWLSMHSYSHYAGADSVWTYSNIVWTVKW